MTLFTSIWNVGLDYTIFLTFSTTMRTISAAKHSSVLSLLEQGYSYCQIHNKTSISLGTISKIGKEVDANKENNPGGCPSKLSAHDKQFIIWQINSGRLDNTVKATDFIDSTLLDPGHPQTVRNALKEAGFHSPTKKKVPMLKLAHCQTWLKFAKISWKLDCGGLEEGVMVRWDQNQSHLVRWQGICLETMGEITIRLHYNTYC